MSEARAVRDSKSKAQRWEMLANLCGIELYEKRE